MRAGASSGILAVVGFFVVAIFVRDALVNAYGSLMVDRPVHYKELPKPYAAIHRKGVFLARDRDRVSSVSFYLWGVNTEQADDWEVRGEMEMGIDFQSL